LILALKFDAHIDTKFNKAYQMLEIINRYFYSFNTRLFSRVM